MPVASNFPTSGDSFGTIPDAPFNQSQTVTANSAPQKHRGLHNLLARALEAVETKLGIGNSAPTTIGHVLRVTGTGVTTYGLLTPANDGVVPKVRVTNSGNTTLTDNTANYMPFTSARWDTDACYSGANPSRLTCKTAGLYQIEGNVYLNQMTSNAGQYALRITLNSGHTVLAEHRGNPNTAIGAITLHVATQYPLAVNDYVELAAVPLSVGLSPRADVQANFSPEFMMTWLCP